MPVTHRTHRLREDRSWLPTTVRRRGWAVSGAIWTGGAAAIAAAVVAAPGLLQTLALGGLGVGLALGGQDAGRVTVQRQLGQLIRGEVPLATLATLATLGSRPDGELVCVRGTIEAGPDDGLEPILGDGGLDAARRQRLVAAGQRAAHAIGQGRPWIQPGQPWVWATARAASAVYRRLDFEPSGRWVHERVADFTLVDDGGARIRVETSGARWVVPPRRLIAYPRAFLTRISFPAEVVALVAAIRGLTTNAIEQALEVGARVQVVGYKTATPHPDGEVIDYRSPPQRPTLRSGPELPLVITRVEDLV